MQTNDDVAVDGCHTLRLTFELIDDLRTDVGCAEVVLVAHDEAEVLVERLERDGSVADFLEEGDEAVLLDAVLVATALLGELSVLVDAGTTEHTETDGLGSVTAQGGKVQCILFSSHCASGFAVTKYYYTPIPTFKQYLE